VAVVQISRIQIRRGQKNQNEGLPQLASGELAWAIDTQELFIGNGSLSEGAPAVGNSKILTQSDDLFELAATYIYKQGIVQTGGSITNPISRSLQARLDDTVSIRAFGATGDNIQDATPIIQRAIDNLYLTQSSLQEKSRVVINFEPGVYTVHNTIFIPPYTTIIGAGPEKTIIQMADDAPLNAPVFKTRNDATGIDADTQFINSARQIRIQGLTIKNNSDYAGLHAESCRDSIFEDLHIIGPYALGDAIQPANALGISTGVGIILDSLSEAVRSSNNIFEKCKISGWSYGVSGNQSISNNIFNNCEFDTLGEGVNFGSWFLSDGKPNNNTIKNSRFTNIYRMAISIAKGTFNQSIKNYFRDVGNEGGSEFTAMHPIIKFQEVSNQITNDYFYRTDALSQTNFNVVDRPYIPEVLGPCHYIDTFTREAIIPDTQIAHNLLKLPAGYDQSYVIHYYLANGNDSFHRIGQLNILCETTGSLQASIVDEYEHLGVGAFDDQDNYIDIDIKFDAVFVNDGTNEAPVYSLYLQSTTGVSVQNQSTFRYTLETRRF